jgi:hypothetical protein
VLDRFRRAPASSASRPKGASFVRFSTQGIALSPSINGQGGFPAATKGAQADGWANSGGSAGSSIAIIERLSASARPIDGSCSLIWGLYIRHLCLEVRKSRRLGLVRRGHQVAITRSTVSSLFDGDTEQSDAFSRG